VSCESEASSFIATIRGRVQGVGYRYYTLMRAQQLGVTGWVRNEADASVRVVAQGRREVLDAFMVGLKVGPTDANVADIDVDWSYMCGNDFGKFEIRS